MGTCCTGLLVMTILFGTGPEGSGVKVNLFGFQPSEIVKYLIVIFLAGFFATNEKFIAEYGRWQKRWQFFPLHLIAILGAIFLFLILGDFGPAMVACFTFIILFLIFPWRLCLCRGNSHCVCYQQYGYPTIFGYQQRLQWACC